MRTPAYWLFAVVLFICGGGDYFATTHLIALATDQGISALTAGNMLAWYGLMSLVGILIAGPAADRVGVKVPMALTFLLRVFLWIMVLEYKSVTFLYMFAFLFGLTHLITAPYVPMLVVKLYGRSHLGVLTGFRQHGSFPRRRGVRLWSGCGVRPDRELSTGIHSLIRRRRSGNRLQFLHCRAKAQVGNLEEPVFFVLGMERRIPYTPGRRKRVIHPRTYFLCGDP